MMNTFARLILLFFTTPLAAETWVELNFSYYNPDWEFRESESGMRLSAGAYRGKWGLLATYNFIATAPVDEPVERLRAFPFKNWRELHLTRELVALPRTVIRADISYQGLEVFGSTRNGHALGLSLSQQLNDRISAGFALNRLRLEERDWRITGELAYSFNDSMSLVTRIDDFAEYDFTWYELGLRVSF